MVPDLTKRNFDTIKAVLVATLGGLNAYRNRSGW